MRICTRRWMTSLVIALGLGVTSLVAAPAASAEEAPTCVLIADPPQYASGQNIISGQGTRDGCVQNRREVVVRIREDRFLLPDRTVAQRTVHNIINDTIGTFWDDCPHGKSATYFTEIYTNAGGSDQSARRAITCINV